MAKKWGLIATVVFAVVLAGTIVYSVIDRQKIDALLGQVRQESQLRTLKGFVSVDVEPFFKDARCNGFWRIITSGSKPHGWALVTWPPRYPRRRTPLSF